MPSVEGLKKKGSENYLLSAGISEGFAMVSLQPSEIVLAVQNADCGGGLR